MEGIEARETGVRITLQCYYILLTWISSKLETLVHYADLVGLAAADTKLWTRPGQLNVDGDQQTDDNTQAQPQQKEQECQKHNLHDCIHVH